MKFLVDMPLSPQLSDWLRSQGHDCVHAARMGLDRTPDSELLAIAAKEGRTVVTADLDFARLMAIYRLTDPGLVLFRGSNFADQFCIDRLKRLFEIASEQEISTSVVVIDGKRIRRRRLPIS